MVRDRSRFEELNFSDNHVGDEGAECLKDGLKNSLTLKRGPAESAVAFWLSASSLRESSKEKMKIKHSALSYLLVLLVLLLTAHYIPLLLHVSSLPTFIIVHINAC